MIDVDRADGVTLVTDPDVNVPLTPRERADYLARHPVAVPVPVSTDAAPTVADVPADLIHLQLQAAQAGRYLAMAREDAADAAKGATWAQQDLGAAIRWARAMRRRAAVAAGLFAEAQGRHSKAAAALPDLEDLAADTLGAAVANIADAVAVAALDTLGAR